MPSARRCDQRPRVILEEPPSEIAPGPIRESGDPDSSAGPGRPTKDGHEAFGKPMIDRQFFGDGFLVGRRASSRISDVCADRLGGPATGQECLSDSFSGHRVSGCSSISDEERSLIGKFDSIDTGGNRPRSVRAFGSGVSPEEVPHVGSSKKFSPERSHVVHFVGTVVAQDSKADICRAIGKRKRPRIPGKKVRLEPNNKFRGGAWRDVGEVLPKRMPFAAVSRLGNSQCFTSGRPHAVSGKNVLGFEMKIRLGCDEHAIESLLNCPKRDTFENFTSGRSRELNKRSVEIASPTYCGVYPAIAWHGKNHFAPTGRSHDHIFDSNPRGNSSRIQAKTVKFAKSRSREAVTTDLVPWKRRLIDDNGGVSGSLKVDCRRTPSWSGTDDEDVDTASLDQ
jgi:hypothetical protein